MACGKSSGRLILCMPLRAHNTAAVTLQVGLPIHLITWHGMNEASLSRLVGRMRERYVLWSNC